MKKKKNQSSDLDQALAAVGSTKAETPKTEGPLAEKDEVKMAEEDLRKRTKKEK